MKHLDSSGVKKNGPWAAEPKTVHQRIQSSLRDELAKCKKDTKEIKSDFSIKVTAVPNLTTGSESVVVSNNATPESQKRPADGSNASLMRLACSSQRHLPWQSSRVHESVQRQTFGFPRGFERQFQVCGEFEGEFAGLQSPFTVKASDVPVDIQLEIAV